jgi:DNA-binding transcriptional ArsR family regulator
MSTLVEAIQAERRALIEPLLAPIADKLRTLEEMERLAVSLNGGGSEVATITPPAPAAKPPKPKQRALPPKAPATTAGLDGLSDQRRNVLTAVRSCGGWIAIGDLTRVTGGSVQAVRKHLGALVARGLVEATGATSARRYRAVVEDKAWSGEEQRALPAPGPDYPDTSSEEGEQPPVAAGRTKSVAVSNGLTPQELKIARARILDHCSRRKLDEQSLATTLDVSREVVADICGQLLLDDKIVLHPDGRYEVPA